MANVEVTFPDSLFAALRKAPHEVGREVRVAASIHWYQQSAISMERAAEFAGLSRAELLAELARRRVDVFVVEEEGLAWELRDAFDYHVVSVEAPEHLRLTVRFRDGLTGDVIFKKSHLRGVFESLNDPAFFALVSCANGFVEWPGEIDLAPDAMHEEILANGTWVLD